MSDMPTDLPDLAEFDHMLIHCPFCGQHDAAMSEAAFTEADAAEEGWGQTTFWSVVCACGAVHGDYPGHDSPRATRRCCMVESKPISLTLQLEREERDSICVRLPGSEGASVFLPVSQIEIAPERLGRRILVTLPRWLAESKGLVSKPDPNQGVLL